MNPTKKPLNRLRLFISLLLPGLLLLLGACGSDQTETKPLTDWVNPFLGTEPLTDTTLIGYTPPEGWRVWAGLTYPGASLPNAMVQLSPVTEFGTGTGYQYEDSVIKAFTHTNKGHWNLCHIPVLPVTGTIDAENLGSGFSHESESASPGYYQVFLEDYGINAELTTTLRAGFHRYDFPREAQEKIVFDLSRSNERVQDWQIEQVDEYTISGYQDTGQQVYFYAVLNKPIQDFSAGTDEAPLSVINLGTGGKEPVELKIGLSFVESENAKNNLETEVADLSFNEVKTSAQQTWEKLLRHIEINGGSERQKELFYSSLYRSFLWPALRSDVNGEYLDAEGNIMQTDFNYYTRPALWISTCKKPMICLSAMLQSKAARDLISRST